MRKIGKILLACGGTGGHLFPAVAAAQEIVRRDPAVQVLFVVSDYPLESRSLDYYGFKCVPAISTRIKSLKNLVRVHDFVRSVWRCLCLIVRFKPDLILGFGGFVSCFPLLIGRLLGVECRVHEQNILPGRITAWAAGFSNQIYLSFGRTAGYLPEKTRGKTVVTGNPIRAALRTKPAREQACVDLGLDPDMFTLLVLGGSQGAHALNLVCTQTVERYFDPRTVQIIHQTGTRDLEWVRETYRKKGIRCCCFDFRQEMGLVYAAADAAVSRAGATALAEIVYYRLPAVLVPYPYAVNDHQRLNAEYYEGKGIALCVVEKDLTPEVLKDRLDALRSRKTPPETVKFLDDVGERARGDSFARALWAAQEGGKC